LLQEFDLDRPLPVRPRYTYALVTPESTGRPQPRLYRDCHGLATGSWEQLNLRLIADVNRNAVGQYKGFAAHSGVLGVNGRAIALPADSKGGKSTLTAAAVMAGFDYASDESLCLDLETGMVEPYPKPITLSGDSCRLLDVEWPADDEQLGERAFVPEDLGGETSSNSLELTDVVFSEYGHEEATLTAVSASEIVAGLLKLSFNHYKQPAESFRVVTEIAQTARAWRLTYGEPAEAVALLRSELVG
jgi:hypothetical protein